MRQVEALIRSIRRDPRDPATLAVDADPRDLDYARFEGRLSEQFDVPVTVEYAREGVGRGVLALGHLDVLNDLLERLSYCDDFG